MLGYEWTNPFAISSAHLVEEPVVPDQPHYPRHEIFPLYDRNSFELPGTLFSVSPPPVAVSPGAIGKDYSVQHYGLSLPPAPAEPNAGPAMRIGLNLGVRSYFASSPDGELMRLGTNVYRRSGGSTGAGSDGGGVVSSAASTARCQAAGCGADLTMAKHYHRRHKVCEFHSKAAAVVAHGLTQRFCQQCSRFHVLSEFDHGKRSCRKRLADHNRRRRKTQPPPALLGPPPPQLDCAVIAAGTSITSPSNVTVAEPSAEGASQGEGTAPVVASAQPVPPSSPTRMALVKSCFRPPEGVPGATCSSWSSSPSSCSSSRSSFSSVLLHVVDFGPYERRVPMSIWGTNADDE